MFRFPILVLVLLCALTACDSGKAPAGIKDTDDDAGTTDTDTDVDTDADSDTDDPECGNGVPEDGEVCDDGNLVSGDGCNSTCTMNDAWDVVANAATEGDQREPALACADDRVMLAFADWSGQDFSGASVMLRFYGSDGIPTQNLNGDDEEFVANTKVVDHQYEPRIALQPGGPFVVVWTDETSSVETGTDVRLRVFLPDGDSLMADEVVSTSSTGEQATPAVAVADDGDFMVVWVDDDPDGLDTDGFGIRGRLFNADGTPQINGQTTDDGEFQVNQVTVGNQFQPDVIWAGDRYLVVWADGSGLLDSDGYGVVGTALDAEAFFVGPETDTLINTATAGLQATPRIASQPGLGALVVWTDDSQTDDVSYYGVRARLIDSDLAGRQNNTNETTGDFQVNTVTNAGQQLPAAVADADGRLAVIWQDWSAEDGSGSGIRGRFFSASGEALVNDLSLGADDFQVNTTFWDGQITPVICATGSWFFAAWEDQSGGPPDESGSAVRFRLLPGI